MRLGTEANHADESIRELGLAHVVGRVGLAFFAFCG
jgi:hypothetical protein